MIRCRNWALIVSAALAMGACTARGGTETDAIGRLSAAAGGDGTIPPSSSLPTSARGASPVLLADGRLLLVGGDVNTAPNVFAPTNLTSIFDPRTGTWGNGPKLNVARKLATAVRLRNGTVAVIGGFDGANNKLASIETWAPKSGSAATFTPAANGLTVPRAGHTATYLRASGRYMIVGGAGPNLAAAPVEFLAPDLAGSPQTLAVNDLPSDVFNHAAAAYESDIYVAGGTSIGVSSCCGSKVFRFTDSGTGVSFVSSATTSTSHPDALLMTYPPGTSGGPGRALIAGGTPESGTLPGTFAVDSGLSPYLTGGVSMVSMVRAFGDIGFIRGVGDLYRYNGGSPTGRTLFVDRSGNILSREGLSTAQLWDGTWLVGGGASAGTASADVSVMRPWDVPAATAASPSPPAGTGATELFVTKENKLIAVGSGKITSLAYTSSSAAWVGSTAPVGYSFPTTGQASVMLADGRLLVTGGVVGGIDSSIVYLVDGAGSPAPTASFVRRMNAGSSQAWRKNHTATLRADGTVLLAGGDTAVLDSVLLTPSATTTDQWDLAGFSMGTPRKGHTATALPDGNVIVIGGVSNLNSAVLGSVERFVKGATVATSGWTAASTGLAVPRAYHSAALMPNGKVLVCGGRDATGSPLSSCEWIDPATGNSTGNAASLATPRYSHAAVLLPNGHHAVFGGTDGSVALVSTEVYVPSINTWMSMGALKQGRTAPCAVVLPDAIPNDAPNRVYVMGGTSGPGQTAIQDSADLLAALPANELGATPGTITGTSGATPVAIGSDLDLSGTRLVRPIEAHGGSARAASSAMPVVVFQNLATGALALAEPVEALPSVAFSDTSIHTVVPSLPLGVYAVRVSTGGGLSRGLPLIVSAAIPPAADGSACSSDAQCQNGHCVAGQNGTKLCCDTACANGCETCVKALGAAADGKCGVKLSGLVCRAANAANPCDVAEACDGTSRDCPMGDMVASNGTLCTLASTGAGVCENGACLRGCDVNGTYKPADTIEGCGKCEPDVLRTGMTPLARGTYCAGGYCDGAGFSCVPGCFIGAPYTPQAANPQNQCELCEPSTTVASVTAWSRAAQGKPCVDTNECTERDQCDGFGKCVGTNSPEGTACSGGNGRMCTGGSCVLGCNVSGAVVQAGRGVPGKPCQTCSTTSPPAVQFAVNGATATCGAGEICIEGECTLGCFVAGRGLIADGTIEGCMKCDARNGGWKPRTGSCDDGDPCTGDGTCSAQGTCSRGPVLAAGTLCGATGAGTACNAQQQCVAACVVGTTGYFPNDVHPTNQCQQCVISANKGTWGGRDGAFEGVCAAGRVCRGGDCKEGCFIGGEFLLPGALPLDKNPCRSCRPGATLASLTSFTDYDLMDQRECGQGAVPEQSDECVAEGCYTDGLKKIFKRGAFCVSGQCQPDQRIELREESCTRPVEAVNGLACNLNEGDVCFEGTCKKGCWIDNAFVERGQASPTNPCLKCQPGKDARHYTVANGDACDDGNPCTSTSSCDNQGACVSDGVAAITGVVAGCDLSGADAGRNGSVCAAGECKPGCIVDGGYVSPGTRSGANDCLACDPARSVIAYSPLAQDTACGPGDEGGRCTAESTCVKASERLAEVGGFSCSQSGAVAGLMLGLVPLLRRRRSR